MKSLIFSIILGIFIGYTKKNTFLAPKPNTQGYISVATGGGQLGNQMFDVAATLA